MSTTTAPRQKTGERTIAEERPFTPGSVWTVQFTRTKPGRGLDYWRQIATTLRTQLEEEKKQGVVLSYRFLTSVPASRDDFNVMVMIEYPNLAALDDWDKADAAMKKVHGSLAAAQASLQQREEVREVIGGKLMREIHLK